MPDRRREHGFRDSLVDETGISRLYERNEQRQSSLCFAGVVKEIDGRVEEEGWMGVLHLREGGFGVFYGEL